MLGGAGLLAGLGAAIAGYAFWHEPRNVKLERLTIRLPQARGRIPPEGLTILHLSDTHFMGRNGREQAKIERIHRQVQGVEYDLLVHTGDFWHYDSGLENVLTLLDGLPQPRLAAYAVLGNHDYTHYAMEEVLPRMWRKYQTEEMTAHGPLFLTLPKQILRFIFYVRDTPLDGRRSGFNTTDRLSAALKSRGFQILHNRAVHLGPEIRGELDLYVAGVDDVVEGRPHIAGALASVPADAPLILLSHNPEVLRSPRINQVDLLLSGHTHGGQIVLPLWGPAHTQVLGLGRHEVAGYFRRGNTQVYITRGIGEGIPLRFNARPQFALITVTA